MTMTGMNSKAATTSVESTQYLTGARYARSRMNNRSLPCFGATASQLAKLFRLNGLGKDSIKLYAEAITLPKGVDRE
jgi:hypothetical protein